MGEVALPSQSVSSITDKAFRCEVKLEVVVAITKAPDILQLVDLRICELDLIQLVLGVCGVQTAVCCVRTVSRCRLGLASVERVSEDVFLWWVWKGVGKSRDREGEYCPEGWDDVLAVHCEGRETTCY